MIVETEKSKNILDFFLFDYHLLYFITKDNNQIIMHQTTCMLFLHLFIVLHVTTWIKYYDTWTEGGNSAVWLEVKKEIWSVVRGKTKITFKVRSLHLIEYFELIAMYPMSELNLLTLKYRLIGFMATKSCFIVSYRMNKIHWHEIFVFEVG